MVLATVTVFLTVVSGVVVLAFWLDPNRFRHHRRSAVSGITHVSVAVVAAVMWLLYVIGRNHKLGRVDIAMIVVAATAGLLTIALSRRAERVDAVPSAIPVPIAVLAVHGVLAALAILGVAAALAAS